MDVRVKLRAEVGAVGGEAGVAQRGQGDFGDLTGIVHREGADDPLFPEIAPLARAVGDEFGEDLRDEDALVFVMPVAVVSDRNSGGIPSEVHGPDNLPRLGLDDGDGAFGVVGDEEQRAVRCQRTTPRLSAYGDLCYNPELRKA